MKHLPFILASVFVSTAHCSNGNAAHASASATQTVVVLQETDVKRSVSNLDCSLLPAGLQSTALVKKITPPSDEDLKIAYARAEKASTRMEVLIELCKPYHGKDIDYFDRQVAERCIALCCKKFGGDASAMSDNFDEWQELRIIQPASLDPLVWRCMDLIGWGSKITLYWGFEANVLALKYMPFKRWAINGQAWVLAREKYVRQTNEGMQTLGVIFQTLPLFPIDLLALVIVYERNPLLTVQDVLSLVDLKGSSVDLSGYMIGDLEGLPPLLEKRLRVSSNKITVIRAEDFSGCQLRSLEIGNNDLVHIAPHSFAQQNKLERLELYQNNLSSLSKDVFAGLTHLRILNVSFNKITQVEPGALLQLTELEELYLHENPFTELPEGLEELALKGKLRLLQLPSCFKDDKKAQEIMAIVAQNKKSWEAKPKPAQ